MKDHRLRKRLGFKESADQSVVPDEFHNIGTIPFMMNDLERIEHKIDSVAKYLGLQWDNVDTLAPQYTKPKEKHNG